MSSHARDNARPSDPSTGGSFGEFIRLALIVVAGAWLLLGAIGCESPFEGLRADSAQAEAASDDPDLDVEIAELDSGFEKAHVILGQRFEGFLDRREFGFGPDLLQNSLRDLRDLGERVSEAPQRLQQLDPADIVAQLFAPIVLLAFLIIFALLDRTFLRAGMRWQGWIHIDVSPLLTRVARSLILVGARIGPFAILVVLSYFPVQALAGQAGWSLFLTHALWLALFYRGIRATLVASFSGQLLDLPRQHSRRLELYATWSARIIFGFLVTLAAVEAFEYRTEAYNFIRFCLMVTVAVLPTYLFFAHDSVLALLPDYQGLRLYDAFRRLIDRYYYWFLAATVGLLSMLAAGYVTASTFILARGYAILLLVTIAFVVGNSVRRFLQRRRESIDTEKLEALEFDTRPDQFTRSLQQLLLVGGGLIMVGLVLELLAIREAASALLHTPLIEVGRVKISMFNLAAAGLIVFGTVHAIKIVRPLLNAKVYPAFSVDVGVAYALNTLLSYILVVVAFLMVLGALGVSLSAITVVIASLGVGIGFGLQTLTENLISGFIILFGRSVKKGDFITVRDTYGRVEAVGARSVVIRTPDNLDMLIPSKEIVGGQITNWTFRDSLVRMRIPVGVTYESDPSHVKEVLLRAAEAARFVRDQPEPEVWLNGMGDSSVNYELLVHYDCREVAPARLKGLIYFDIWEALHEAGIEIPFPQRDLHVKSAEIMPELGKLLRQFNEAGDEDGPQKLPPVDMEDSED
jgi:small-conductance mechanosensitive channel